jgi:hypothetical protein
MAKNNGKINFSDSNKGLNSSGTIQELVDVSSTREFTSNEIPRGFYVLVGGDVEVKDSSTVPVAITYPFVTGETVAFMPTEVTTDSTAKLAIWW